MERRPGAGCRRIPWVAVLQNHDRRHRSRVAATKDGELITVPSFTGAAEQLWQIDQLSDGTYRIMPKAIPESKDRLSLSAIGNSSVVLSKFDPKSNKQHWNFKCLTESEYRVFAPFILDHPRPSSGCHNIEVSDMNRLFLLLLAGALIAACTASRTIAADSGRGQAPL